MTRGRCDFNDIYYPIKLTGDHSQLHQDATYPLCPVSYTKAVGKRLFFPDVLFSGEPDPSTV